jgi:hypothetical protein
MPTPTPDQIALVKQLLPSAAMDSEEDGGYGWSDVFIAALMLQRDFTPTEAVRYFWLQRVNETAEYLNTGGKSLTDIHKQAREMLDYWDNVIKSVGSDAIGPGDSSSQVITFGEIELPASYCRISRGMRA